jgi:hypothetical protein
MLVSILIVVIVWSSIYPFFKRGVVADETLPLIDTVLQLSDNYLIDDMDSGWTAIYGSVTYDTDDFISSYASLKGIPAQQGSEKLRIEKTFSQPLNLSSHNIGFWVKTSGSIPTDFTFYFEAYDATGKMRQWVSYRMGSKLMGSDAVWSYHFVISTGYSYTSSIDMANIIKIQLKFFATTSDWTISIDELKAYPNQVLFPNGAVMLTFDGRPYQPVYDWAEPKLDEYSYAGCIATASELSPDIQSLSRLEGKGWDIGVYGRIFDQNDPLQYLPINEILQNTIGELTWLQSNGIGFPFLQCNRHLIDVYTEDLLDDTFYFIKGSAWMSNNMISFPSLAFYGISNYPESDLANLERAHQNQALFIWFNHLDGGSYGAAYDQTEFNTFVDRIHELGMEVITYSMLLDRYLESADLPADNLSERLRNHRSGPGKLLIRGEQPSQRHRLPRSRLATGSLEPRWAERRCTDFVHRTDGLRSHP